MEINKNNYLSLAIDNLTILKDAFADDNISSMIYDGDDEDKIEELQDLIDYLQKIN